VGPQVSRKVKSVRKPVIDLELQARERRPGQVMPGDPAPVVGVPGTAPVEGGESVNPAAPKGSIPLPDTSPAARPALKPAADTSARQPVMEGAAPTAEAAPVQAVPVQAAPVQVATSQAATTPVAPTSAAPTRATPMHAEPLPHTEAMASENEPAPAKPEPVDPGIGIVDRSIVTNISTPLATGPAKVRVESLSGDSSGVQWRGSGESWRTPATGDASESRLEVRAGLDSELVVVVDERVQIRITRLGRAVIERTEEVGGTTAVSITLMRGAAEIRPVGSVPPEAGQMFARVRTPDQMFGVTGALRVEYDAFTGTRRRTANP
jgi:hypothetical protein